MLPRSQTLSNTVGEALDWNGEGYLPRLVVAEGNEYKGMISEDLLLDNPVSEQHISSVHLLNTDTLPRRSTLLRRRLIAIATGLI